MKQTAVCTKYFCRLLITACFFICHPTPAKTIPNTYCGFKVLVTSPQTVSFFAGPVIKQNFIGTTLVSKWLKASTQCVQNDYIRAETWDINGNRELYLSKQKQDNVNNVITLIYPDDFNAPLNNTSILCQMQLMNNSNNVVAFYSQFGIGLNAITILQPWQATITPSMCLKNKLVLARIQQQMTNQQWVDGPGYRTNLAITNINTQPLINFPDDFHAGLTIT